MAKLISRNGFLISSCGYPKPGVDHETDQFKIYESIYKGNEMKTIFFLLAISLPFLQASARKVDKKPEIEFKVLLIIKSLSNS